jgi:hypothetical protein
VIRVGQRVSRAGGEEEQGGSGRDHRHHPEQGLLGRFVGPMEILDHDDDRPSAADLGDQHAERFEQPGAAFAGVHARHRLVAGIDAEEEPEVGHGREGRGVPPGGAGGEPVDHRGVVVGLLDTEGTFDDLDERQVGDVPAVGDAMALQPCDPVRRRTAVELGDEARLSEAGVARHESDPT